MIVVMPFVLCMHLVGTSACLLFHRFKRHLQMHLLLNRKKECVEPVMYTQGTLTSAFLAFL